MRNNARAQMIVRQTTFFKLKLVPRIDLVADVVIAVAPIVVEIIYRQLTWDFAEFEAVVVVPLRRLRLSDDDVDDLGRLLGELLVARYRRDNHVATS